MVKFKDWEEFVWFVDNYRNFSCLNCTYGGKQGKPSQFLFCMRTVAMVDFKFMSLCAEWKSKNGKSLEEYVDCPMWSLSDTIVDKLNNGEMSVEELRIYGVDYEKLKESESD
ncbi:MAG: hypothetical protein J6Y78_04550 [Paludibacteraceae bacterium]|nr:hypothetical protein [Paludibacteraceae bacterium]